MASDLKSEASEWEVGSSDPSEFTADAVVEVLSNASDEEAKRIGDAEFNGENAKKRSTVGTAASDRVGELSNSGDESEGNDESDTEKGTEGTPEENTNTGDPDKVDSLPDPKGDGYDPSLDPSVPSSAVADVVRNELAGSGDSPTLNYCREEFNKQGNK